MGFSSKLKEKIEPVIIHGIGIIIAIAFLWLVDRFLFYTMGDKATFFDLIPIKYTIHAGEVLVIARFVRLAWKEFKNP